MYKIIFLALTLSCALTSPAMASITLPGVPADTDHPGSKVYSHDVERVVVKCNSRDVIGYLPQITSQTNSSISSQTNPISFPAIVFGHGQALNDTHYKATFEHLAKKGIAAIYPTYDTGFFDQNWLRMAEDYVDMSTCFIKKYPQINASQIVFSGHSKGAYVATTAAGLAFEKNKSLVPSSVIVFNTAGVIEPRVRLIDPSVELTVVFSDKDTIVERTLSEKTLKEAGSQKKQLIELKSYGPDDVQGELNADHFWILTAPSFAGGGHESAFHYYSAWKWLIAAALDVQNGGDGTHPLLFGPEALEKGVPGLLDTVESN